MAECEQNKLNKISETKVIDMTVIQTTELQDRFFAFRCALILFCFFVFLQYLHCSFKNLQLCGSKKKRQDLNPRNFYALPKISVTTINSGVLRQDRHFPHQINDNP